MKSDKVVFITGSARRIGACTAEHLHTLGYRVVLHCHQSVNEAQELNSKLNSSRKDSSLLVQGDISDIRQLETIASQAISAFGRLDVLINNASSFHPTPIGEISEQDWHSLVGSNMQGPLFLSQLCQKQLSENQGVIINMVDIHAESPLKGHTLYCMAKAALVMMTKSLAKELAPAIRVNGVAPGAILWPEAGLTDIEQDQILSQVPMNKLGSPQDIAGAISYLIQAPYVTGQILAVDGGRSLGSSSKA